MIIPSISQKLKLRHQSLVMFASLLCALPLGCVRRFNFNPSSLSTLNFQGNFDGIQLHQVDAARVPLGVVVLQDALGHRAEVLRRHGGVDCGAPGRALRWRCRDGKHA